MDKTQTLIPKPPFFRRFNFKLNFNKLILNFIYGAGNEVIFHFQMRVSTLRPAD